MSNEEMKSIACELSAMECTKNEGRGVESVRTLIFYLNEGKLSAACAVANNEWDKISSYEDISNFLIKHKLFIPIQL